jgi:hypothetical protein
MTKERAALPWKVVAGQKAFLLLGARLHCGESLPEQSNGQKANMSIDSCCIESSGFIIA